MNVENSDEKRSPYGAGQLPKEIAIKIAQQQVDWFDNAFKQVLGRFNKRRLLAWLAHNREKTATAFFNGTPSIDLSKFLSVTVLMKRVMSDYDLPGEEEANEENTPELIELFSGYVIVVERKYLMEEDFGHYIAENAFSVDQLDKDTLMSNFKFVTNEDFIPVLESFENNLIMNKDAAEKFLKENKEEYEKIQSSKPHPVARTPEDTIKILFPTLMSFFCALTKNKLYADTFNLAYLKNAEISPDFILKFIQNFTQKSGFLTQTTPKQFKDVVRKKFKSLDKNNVYDSLVFSRENKHAFPFFIKLDDNVFVSHNFIRLMGLFYYPFYFEKVFSKEIEIRSNEFEKKVVPERLIELGFKVIPDVKNSSLQIDQIAWKNDCLYVIETKVWDLKPFFEHRRIHNYRERDLKGVVDGKKYSTINGEQRVEEIPSLLDKVAFVRTNLNELCPDSAKIKEIKGLVITKSHPTIKEYKGIQFIGCNKLEML